MGLTLDTRRLTEALLFVESVSGRSCADSLNRAGKHAIIGSGSGKGAMQLTPKADKAKIRGLDRKLVRGFVVQRLKASHRWPLPSATVNQLVEKEIKRRLRGVGYAAYAGYSNAAKAFGARGLKGVNENFSKSEAKNSYGKKATRSKLRAEFTNTTPAIEKIGGPALQEGVDNAAHDLEIYGQKKWSELFRRLGGR